MSLGRALERPLSPLGLGGQARRDQLQGGGGYSWLCLAWVLVGRWGFGCGFLHASHASRCLVEADDAKLTTRAWHTRTWATHSGFKAMQLQGKYYL